MTDTEPERRWLTADELAARLRLHVATINAWAGKGIGPRRHKFGGRVRFLEADVIAWEDAQAEAS